MCRGVCGWSAVGWIAFLQGVTEDETWPNGRTSLTGGRRDDEFPFEFPVGSSYFYFYFLGECYHTVTQVRSPPAAPAERTAPRARRPLLRDVRRIRRRQRGRQGRGRQVQERVGQARLHPGPRDGTQRGDAGISGRRRGRREATSRDDQAAPKCGQGCVPERQGAVVHARIERARSEGVRGAITSAGRSCPSA